jgi:unsaturated rhamnogalacturonyl hydrolase
MTMPDSYFEKVRSLCDYLVKAREPKMRWMWGEALFGYALSELDAYLCADAYTPFLKGFCDYYIQNQPRVDYSDTCAPALITYAMQKKTGNPDYAKLTDRVLDFIRHEPRLIGEAVNHLGHSPESRGYPKSIWVDSLMMFSVFPARYASETGDRELLDYAARQPGLYSRYLQDPKDGLWAHSYWIKRGKPYPEHIYWGRGNGWAVCSLPMILESIGADHPAKAEILGILGRTARAVLACQRPDGTFPTVLGRNTYRELSATALIAAGIMQSVRCGYLPREFLNPVVRAFRAVAGSIREDEKGAFLPEISTPTIPLPVAPYLGYVLTPRGKNLPYGVAAAVFAAIEYDKLEKMGLI